MNKHLKNLNKIEFVVTYACTGRCRHCSEGDHSSCGDRINPDIAADAVRRIASEYDIRTVMTFGGEPLLYPDAVCKIHGAARDMGVSKRQIITNGYFSKDPVCIAETVRCLSECGVNNILLSADAFHQETIPLDIVRIFATEVQKRNIPIKLQPAWLVSDTSDNPYNRKTHEILESFGDMGLSANEGNVIFPEGNALKYLGEYFDGSTSVNPYAENPFDVRCLSFDPNGNVLDDNVYRRDITDIVNEYDPKITD